MITGIVADKPSKVRGDRAEMLLYEENGVIELLPALTDSLKNGVAKNLLVNGRNLTNFGLFRKYINEYLLSHPGLNKNMVLI